ncbi:MAG TPA: hypothetical protein VN240_10955, partial [Propylenella sp.]|nr:hypothetical protein [Propylenella sp.]
MISLLKAFVTPLVYCLLASTAAAAIRRSITGTACAAMAVAAVLLGVSAPNASAGVFEVANCEADQLNYSTRAFAHFATRRMMIKRACNPVGPGLRGLIISNVAHDGRVKRGAVAGLVFQAPAGTQIKSFNWAGYARRRDCRFAMEMWAEVPGRQIPIVNVKANRRCPSPGKAQAAYLVRSYKKVAGATKIVQRVICRGKGRRPWCSARGLNFLRTQWAEVRLVDNLPPSVAILPTTPLARGAWVSGTQPLAYTAFDNVGVHVARAVFGGRERGIHNRACALAGPAGPFAHPTPCPNGPGRIDVRTLELTDGTQQLSVTAVDSAGNRAASGPRIARIDNTPPTRVNVAIDGGEAWRNSNDFLAAWSNVPEGDRAPIAAANYRLCARGTTDCTSGTRSEPDVSRLSIAVPRPGEWTLSIWRRDAAGNQAADNASVPVTLRYDPEPPQLAFEPPRTTDPTLIAVRATDEVSGLAVGAIEIGAVGTGLWRTLATQRSASGLVARINDATLPPGAYILRARATDQAGNEASTDRRADGQPMIVNLPLRTAVSLQGGFERSLPRRGKRKPEVVLQQTARIGFRHPAVIAGRLVTASGRSVAGARLQLLTRTGAVAEQLVETLTTDAAGRFRLVTTGINSRALRVVYGGSSVTLPSQLTLEMRVPA